MTDSGWFSADYDYSGDAEVVFKEPHAEFYGPASVLPDELGQPVVRMTVERTSPAVEDDVHLLAVQWGWLPGPERAVGIGGGTPNTACVTVRGKDGVFRGAPGWDYEFSNQAPGGPLAVQLRPMRSEHAAGCTGEAKFLVLPLAGFSADLPSALSGIGAQPLKLIRSEDSGEPRCIHFLVDGKPAFIQALPEEGIKPWGGETVLNALAVVPFAEPAMIDPRSWFLSLFLRLLGLATGCEVGAPWIELRDEAGRLVRRLHVRLGSARRLTGGYAATPKACHWIGGEFLTAALASTAARERFFSIALRHCVRAGLPGLTLDDQLTHIVRALECLCKRYGLSVQDLTCGLDGSSKSQVRLALDRAADEVQSLAGAPDSKQHSQISQIARRVRSASQKEASFGLAVQSLADRFGLLDAKVLAPYYAGLPRDWVQSMSYYRGAVLHEGFIDIDSQETPVGEVLGFVLYLHDLLVRVLLKIVGYRGTYQPRLMRGLAAETADWFREGVQAESLLRVPTVGL